MIPESRRVGRPTVAALILLATTVGQAQGGPAGFVVDFSRPGGPPLVKDKFGVYATPFTPVAELVRGLPMLAELNVRDFRYEVAWGKPDAVAFDQIAGTALAPTIDFRPLDAMLAGLAAQRVQPLLALSYCPVPLKTRTPWDAWKDVPSHLDSWQKIHASYGEHFASRSSSRQAPWYEVWNEPDMPEGGGKMFFNGTADDYVRVYDSARAGLRAGDPEAQVGGPAAAYDLSYLRPLLTRPIEFASIHGYANYRAQLDGMRTALRDRPDLPIYLTEYASFNAFPLDGPSTKAEAAARFFADVPGLLEYGDVPKIYWAQWVDDVLGLVGRDGKRRALFNAFALYGMMPIDRALVAPDPTPGAATGLTAFASFDPAGHDGAAIALANVGESDRTVRLDLRHLPRGLGEIELLRVDPRHASARDDPSTERLRVDERLPLTNAWTGLVPKNGIVLLRMRPKRPTPVRAVPKATLARTIYAFPDRLSGAQAHFDPRTMIARLSIEGPKAATASIGAMLDGLPRRFRLKLSAVRGLRVAVAFPGTPAPPRPVQNGIVDLTRLAPKSWDGRRTKWTFTLEGIPGDRARIEFLR